MRRVISAIAVTSSLLIGLPIVSSAQSLPGFTLWSGVERENQLDFRLDYGGKPGVWDRYRLEIPAKKMNLAASQFNVSYPDNYRGKFDPDEIEVRIKGKKVPLQEVVWDKENHLVEIYPEEPVPAGTSVELVFSNVKNPAFGGMYYFNGLVVSPGDVPLPRYVGTWILSLGG